MDKKIILTNVFMMAGATLLDVITAVMLEWYVGI
jgi:hypothetical protein